MEPIHIVPAILKMGSLAEKLLISTAEFDLVDSMMKVVKDVLSRLRSASSALSRAI